MTDIETTAVPDLRSETERRGKNRRSEDRRINRSAPGRSLMKVYGTWATAMTSAIFAIVFAYTLWVSHETPWIALCVTSAAVVVANFALMLGLIEQRLIEIRLELMIANGGQLRADRRHGERRNGSGQGSRRQSDGPGDSPIAS